tara:strand:- start:136 stop:933 length:798 start_codon:yes stop_codon:yes gene_type:complete
MKKIIKKKDKEVKKHKQINNPNVIDIASSLANIKSKNSNEILVLAPSELDYKPKKCQRCFYLEKNHKIGPKDFPPPVFSRFDVVQQAYYKDKNTSDLTKELPSGRIMNKDELPGRVVSETLTDNKAREFILGGRPDIVIKFDQGGYGIIDFKTTKISDNKSENYKHQLEAYAQIFTKPGSTKSKKTPLLNPITHMGILQFDPSDIQSHNDTSCNMKMNISYSPLKRDEKDFFENITKIIDILNNPSIPNFTEDCDYCKFVEDQIN